MPEATLIIEGTMPDLNEVIDEAKIHWSRYYKLKKTWTDIVAWSCLSQRIPHFENLILIVSWIEPNRRKDPDNIAFAKKFILDGLVSAKVIDNDGWNHVLGWTDEFIVDKDNPRVKVCLKGRQDIAKEFEVPESPLPDLE